MAGRKKDPIWIHFVEEPTLSGKSLKATCKSCGKFESYLQVMWKLPASHVESLKATCKSCGKQLMVLVERMNKHFETCQKEETEEDQLCDSASAQKSYKGDYNISFG
ncbi:hypothetical protein PR048_016439 [Dryococelus australis]|uniref:BED-type domain-containing protein n=1 Tax=Dryococelus australis TaxID=614101 RepID=A0ABQ9HJS1_9NEOP|nr:hypothetical protein PR048_016439 [Dryococelus australis]